MFADCHPRYKEEITDATVRTYAIAFEGVPMDWIERATLRMARDPSVKEFPGPAEIRAYAIKSEHPSLPSPVDAWVMAQRGRGSWSLVEWAMVGAALEASDSDDYYVFVRVYESMWSRVVRDFDVAIPETQPVFIVEPAPAERVLVRVLEEFQDDTLALGVGEIAELPIGLAVVLRARGVVEPAEGVTLEPHHRRVR